MGQIGKMIFYVGENRHIIRRYDITDPIKMARVLEILSLILTSLTLLTHVPTEKKTFLVFSKLISGDVEKPVMGTV